MKKINTIQYSLIIFILIVLSACQKNNQQTNTKPEVEALQGTLINISSEFDGIFPVDFCDDILVYASYSLSNLWVKGQLVGDSLTRVEHFMPKGIGPGQTTIAALNIQDPMHFCTIDENRGNLGELVNWEAPSYGHFADAKQISRKKITPKSAMCATADNFLLLSADKALIFTWPFSDPNTIASIVDYADDEIKSIRLWPDDDFKGPARIKASAFDYMAFMSTDGNGTFAYAAWSTPYMFLFNLEGRRGTVKITKTLYADMPLYSAEADNMNFKYEYSVDNHIKCASNHKHIYVLMTDKTPDGKIAKKPADAKYGNRIDVFNWQGDLVRRLELDQLGERILVDNHDQALYLTNHDPETEDLTMRRYKL